MSPVVHPWREVTPLPKLQLFIILLVLFAEPITSTVIFPFINQVCHPVLHLVILVKRYLTRVILR